jgi:hypothetical protein
MPLREIHPATRREAASKNLRSIQKLHHSATRRLKNRAAS